jgi:hypothetical protein
LINQLRYEALLLEQRFAGRRAGIDTLAIEVKVNPGCVNLAENADKIL